MEEKEIQADVEEAPVKMEEPETKESKKPRKPRNHSGPEEAPIEKWAEQLKTPGWALAGTKRLNRWGQGRVVTQRQYEKAIEEFTRGPMDQPRKTGGN